MVVGGVKEVINKNSQIIHTRKHAITTAPGNFNDDEGARADDGEWVVFFGDGDGW